MIDLKLNIDVRSRLSSGQARKQMSERDLKSGDILNVLKTGKIFSEPEYENGSFRYLVQTQKITVVVVFRKPNHVLVVTAWRE